MINLIMSLFMTLAVAEVKTPKTVKELKMVTAQISNLERNHGGSGTVIRADETGSIILTNEHVCNATNPSWIVTVNNKSARINKIKKFDRHDLCLIHVMHNFGYSVDITGHLPEPTEVSIVSGHPLMLPQIVTYGHFSEEMEVEIMVDIRECTPEEEKKMGFECMFGIPITKKYQSQLVSNLIQPGNSGSAVLDDSGKVAGVIFAGQGQLSFGFIVPALYVSYFVNHSDSYKWEDPKSAEKKVTDEKIKLFCKRKSEFPACHFSDLVK